MTIQSDSLDEPVQQDDPVQSVHVEVQVALDGSGDDQDELPLEPNHSVEPNHSDEPVHLKHPDKTDFERWARAVLIGRREHVLITVRITGERESARLNQTYRHTNGPTNVLSFPFDYPPGMPVEPDDPAQSVSLLGDLVICAPLVIREAQAQGKLIQAHWAHLLIHGILHLLGYNHNTVHQAAEMEQLEIDLLAGLGFTNPYIEV